jgi:high-affinity nickel permease
MSPLTLEQKKKLVKNLGKYFAIGNSALVLGVVVFVLVKLL